MTQEYTLYPTDDRPSITFEGELLADITHKRNNSVRWTEMRSYRTLAGKLIVEVAGVTNMENETLRTSVYIFNTVEQMTRKLGFTIASEKLYRKMGIDNIVIS